MTHNPYEPPKSAESERKPYVPPQSASKSAALSVLVLGIVILITGAHFTDPKQMATIASPALKLAAIALHLGGGITFLVGIYRLWRAMRSS